MVKIGILNSVFVRLWLLVHILYVNSQEKSNFVDKGLDSANIEYIHMETMKSRSSIKKRANFVPHPDTMHELTFAVKQSNADKIHNMLMERSTPGQPLYQRWISHDEVRALTSNPDASYTLLKWFEEQKLSLVWSSKNQEYFRVRTSISHWERILRTSFYEYHEVFGVRTLRTHTSAIRAESYSLPVTIAKHVHTVFGASQFPVPIRRLGSSRFSNSELKTSFATPPLVTPLTLATQYAIPIRNG